MMNKEQIAASAAATKVAQEQTFQRWLQKPEIKLLISMIPETSPVELLETLLRTAYEGGAGFGSMDTMSYVLASYAKSEKDGRE